MSFQIPSTRGIAHVHITFDHLQGFAGADSMWSTALCGRDCRRLGLLLGLESAWTMRAGRDTGQHSRTETRQSARRPQDSPGDAAAVAFAACMAAAQQQAALCVCYARWRPAVGTPWRAWRMAQHTHGAGMLTVRFALVLMLLVVRSLYGGYSVMCMGAVGTWHSARPSFAALD